MSVKETRRNMYAQLSSELTTENISVVIGEGMNENIVNLAVHNLKNTKQHFIKQYNKEEIPGSVSSFVCTIVAKLEVKWNLKSIFDN